MKNVDLQEFLLHGHRKRNFDKEVWVPLRAHFGQRTGEYGSEGYLSDFFGAGSVAVPLSDLAVARSSLDWHNNGLARDHKGYIQDGIYYPAEVYEGNGFRGVNLVIAQEPSHNEPAVWYLNPDLITTLNLRREGNKWLAADEGFTEVVRYFEDAEGKPQRIEMRADFLKDYLCARELALCISTYAERDVIVSDIDGTDWTVFGTPDLASRIEELRSEKPVQSEWHQRLTDGRWEGRAIPIHEGGHSFGSGFAVFHVGRRPLELEPSIPEIAPSDEMITSKREGQFRGRLLYRVTGEVWRDQWVQPAAISVRVRGDEPPPTCFFIVDAAGTRTPSERLRGGGRWLWFNPAVINASLPYRGASLSWYTRDTGRIEMAKNRGVHFGVNNLGLINVYAKDVAFMPVWQQTVWSGFNVAPDGGVSKELLASQAEGEPSETLAPEPFLLAAREELDKAMQLKFGRRAFRGHSSVASIAAQCHRFRALDKNGLLELAKDLARITVDDIDLKGLQEIIPLLPNEKRGSLKSLERIVAKLTDDSIAATKMSALFHIYDLRLADAHLASSEADATLQKLGLDMNLPAVIQGRDMLVSLVDAIYGLVALIKGTC